MAYINKPKRKYNSPSRQLRQKYYQSAQWRNLSKWVLMSNPICQECGEAPSEHCHHIQSPFNLNLSDIERDALMYDPHNLKALCAKCHAAEHTKKNIKKMPQLLGN